MPLGHDESEPAERRFADEEPVTAEKLLKGDPDFWRAMASLRSAAIQYEAARWWEKTCEARDRDEAVWLQRLTRRVYLLARAAYIDELLAWHAQEPAEAGPLGRLERLGDPKRRSAQGAL